MQTCVSILTLGVDIGTNLHQLADRFDILADNSDIERRSTQVVMEIEFRLEVNFGHLSYILCVIVSCGLQNELLFRCHVLPF